MKILLMALLTIGLSLNAVAETIWLDVRSASEYAAGHVDGSINIPHTEVKARFPAIIDKKDSDIKVYCRSGRRAEFAKSELEALGYTKVQNLGSLEKAKTAKASMQ